MLRHLSRVIVTAIAFCGQFNVIAQWTKTLGPPGINVNHFYRSGNSLFAGTSSKGVFRSSDNGVTWQAANAALENSSVFTLIADNTYLYAGTDNGVFRSNDNGLTWQAANSGIENHFIKSFYIVNNVLFAGTIGSGLFKSSTQGSSWSDANGNALNSSTIHAITYSAPHLVVVADNLIFYSDNGGNSWFFDQSSPFILTGNPSFVTTHDSVMVSAGTGVYRSFDGGVHWGNLSVIDFNTSIAGMVGNKNTVVAGAKNGIYFSNNFGSSWKAVPPQGLRQGGWLCNDFYLSGNNLLLAYNEIGVGYSSNKGSNWNYTLSGFTPAATIDNALFNSGNILFSGTHGDGVYQSNNGGSNWTKTGTSNNLDTLSNSNVFAVLKVSNNIVLAGTCGNGLYRSTDKGFTWGRIRNGLPEQNGFLCVQSLARTTTNVLVATDQGVYYSSDLGLTWHFSTLFNVDAVAVVANGSVACAAVEAFTSTNKIYRSTDNGQTWTSVFESSFDDWASMASDGTNYFYVGTLATSNYVSSDNGVTWRTVGGGIQGSGGYAIGVKGPNVFIGNNTGVYFSNNNGASFTQANTGFDPSPNNSVQGFAFSSTDVYAGLFQNSVWKRPLSDFGITPKANEETKSEIYASVTPNPVIGESKLNYHVDTRAPVIINLYNTNGNLVTNLVSTTKDTGDYNVYISKNNLREGNYFISIVVGNKHTIIAVSIK